MMTWALQPAFRSLHLYLSYPSLVLVGFEYLWPFESTTARPSIVYGSSKPATAFLLSIWSKNRFKILFQILRTRIVGVKMSSTYYELAKYSHMGLTPLVSFATSKPGISFFRLCGVRIFETVWVDDSATKHCVRLKQICKCVESRYQLSVFSIQYRLK